MVWRRWVHMTGLGVWLGRWGPVALSLVSGLCGVQGHPDPGTLRNNLDSYRTLTVGRQSIMFCGACM
eukprot:scaffold2727_cov140-Isochrysis_galbana.AAC.4